MLLFIWFLFTLPSDHVICSLWISELPTPEALIQSCGTDALNAYRLDVLHDGKAICTRPASMLLNIVDACGLELHLSEYRLNIIEPNYQTMIGCSVTTSTNAQPSAEEIRRQCPHAYGYVIKFAGTQADSPAPSICLPPQIEQPIVIATSETYHLLAGKLIWWGLANAKCEGGYSGVDPITYAATACGMDGARARMLDWQNGMDAEIIAAADRWHVPALLIKDIIAMETQYWPWTGTDGEHGLIQITEDGAELVLHQYQPGYDRLNPAQRHEARVLWLRQLDCDACSPPQAYEHARLVMDLYAQAIAAYYCTYGDWAAAMRAWNIKHQVGGS